MASTPRRTSIRQALTVGAVAVAAALTGVSAPAASAAPAAVTAVSTLDTPEGWAAVQANADAGYPVPDAFAASCGATQ